MNSNDQGLTLDKLLLRVANLDFALKQLELLKIRFFTTNGSSSASAAPNTSTNKTNNQIVLKADNNDAVFKAAVDSINSTAKVNLKSSLNFTFFLILRQIFYSN